MSNGVVVNKTSFKVVGIRLVAMTDVITNINSYGAGGVGRLMLDLNIYGAAADRINRLKSVFAGNNVPEHNDLLENSEWNIG